MHLIEADFNRSADTHLIRVELPRLAVTGIDLLRLNGEDLRQRPLEARREALKRLVAKRRGDGVLFNEALAEDGAVVFAKACELGLEGIVSKRQDSFYKSGPSRNWPKTKNPDFVRT